MMKMLIVAIMLFPFAAAAQFDGGQAGRSALAALSILPDNYAQNVVRVSADNADPDPETWYVMTYKGTMNSPLRSLAISDGEIKRDDASYNPAAYLRSRTPINPDRVLIDSPRAYQIAEAYCIANNKQLDSVSFALSQQGKAAVPVWEIWCYDSKEKPLGYLKISATEGSVFTAKGFKNTPDILVP
jgi:hypothetical protein